METDNGIENTGAPAQEGAGGEQHTPTIFETFKEKYGVEIADEGALVSHYGEVFEKSKAADELRVQLEAANARQPEYPTEAAAELAAFQRALVAEGVTDKVEVFRRTREFIEENSTVYSELAESNPAMVIEKGIRAANKHLSEAEIKHLVKKEGAAMPDPVNEADFAGDPEGLAEAKAEYDEKMLDLRIRAKSMLPKLEEGKKKLDFQPKGFKTKEELDADQQAYNKSIADSAEAYKAGFKGLKAGSETLEVPKDRFDQLWAEFAKPQGLADQVYSKLMDPSSPDGFAELANLIMLKEELPNILAREREVAESNALKKFKDGLRQGGGSGADFTGDEIGGEAYKKAIATYTPA